MLGDPARSQGVESAYFVGGRPGAAWSLSRFKAATPLHTARADGPSAQTKCSTAVSHLRPLAGGGSDVTYSMLLLTQARKAFLLLKTAFGKTT